MSRHDLYNKKARHSLIYVCVCVYICVCVYMCGEGKWFRKIFLSVKSNDILFRLLDVFKNCLKTMK